MTSIPAPSAPSFSDEDLESAIAVLQQDLEGEVQELFSLTDEELLAVDGVQHPQMTELPWVQANADAPELRELMAAVAMRSLLARGLITTSADEDPAEYSQGSRTPLSFDAAPELRGVAVLRRIPEAFVLIRRRTSAGNATSYFYLFDVQGRARVLWEAYDASGMHVFHLVPFELLAAQVVSFLDPEGGLGQEDGQPQELPVQGFEQSEQAAVLAGAHAVSSVAIASVAHGSTEGFTTFAQPDHLVLMESDEETHRVGAISEPTLLGILEDLAAAAMPSTGS